MTTISMQTAYGAGTIRPTLPPAIAALPARLTAAVDQVSTRINDWALDHLLDAAGGLTLALLPFSFLAWMFIAR